MKKKVSKFDEDFIKNYDEDSNKEYILEVDDLPFLSERMRIKKCNNLVCNLYDKKEYVVHIITLKQALDHGLILNKLHKVIQFN